MRAPVSIMSKSRTRFSAAMTTTNRLKPIPIQPLPLTAGTCNVEETENHLGEIEDGDAACRGDHTQPEALSRANDACLVCEQHDEQHAKREADRLESDARIGLLKDGGNAAEDKPFQKGVERRRKRGPGFLEDGDESGDQPAEKPAHHPGYGLFGIRGVRETPRPGGRGDHTEQEQAGFVDGPLHGHRFTDGDLTLKSFLVQSWICGSKGIRHGLFPLHYHASL